MNDDIDDYRYQQNNFTYPSHQAAALSLISLSDAIQRTAASAAIISPVINTSTAAALGPPLGLPGMQAFTSGVVGSIPPNSSPSAEPVWLPASVTFIRGACLLVLSLLGALLNAFMIVAIAPNRRLRTVRNILLVHLGAVGLVSSMFITAYPAISTFHGHWLGGHPMCQIYAYTTGVLTSVSVWTIAALSWDKYQTIASPLHHSLTATVDKMLPCFLAFWAFGLGLSLPPLLGANEFVFHATMGICGVNSSSVSGRWYTCVLIGASFVLPFCLMVYCYAHIFRIARTQSSRIAATMLRMVSVIQAPIASTAVSSSSGPATSLSLRGTKAMGTILQLIGSFVLTYLPYTVTVLYETVFSVHASAIFVSIATTLFLAAPFTHAAIYGLRNQILRKSFYRYARRKFHDCKARRQPGCCFLCMSPVKSSKRRGSCAKVPSGFSNKRLSSSMKSPGLNTSPPHAVRCVVQADGSHQVLKRSLSLNHQKELALHNLAHHRLRQYQNSPTAMTDDLQSPSRTIGYMMGSGDLEFGSTNTVTIPRPLSLNDIPLPHVQNSQQNTPDNLNDASLTTTPLLGAAATNGVVGNKCVKYNSLANHFESRSRYAVQDEEQTMCPDRSLSKLGTLPHNCNFDVSDTVCSCKNGRDGFSTKGFSKNNCNKDIFSEMSLMDWELKELDKTDDDILECSIRKTSKEEYPEFFMEMQKRVSKEIEGGPKQLSHKNNLQHHTQELSKHTVNEVPNHLDQNPNRHSCKYLDLECKYEKTQKFNAKEKSTPLSPKDEVIHKPFHNGNVARFFDSVWHGLDGIELSTFEKEKTYPLTIRSSDV